MPKHARNIDVSQRKPTFLRAWRTHRKISLYKLRDVLEEEHGITITTGQLSRIERGEQPYAQDLLEALAKVLNASTADLLALDPQATYEDETTWPVLRLWATLEPGQKRQALDLLGVLIGKPKED